MDCKSVSDLATVQKRLYEAAMKQPGLNQASFGISAYINGVLQSARTDALVDLYLNPPNATWSPQEAWDAALLRALTAKAEQLEANIQQIQIAPADRRILAAN